MKRYAALLLGGVSFLLPGLCEGQTAQTRATLYNENNAGIFPNNLGLVTPQAVNSMFGNTVASSANLNDVNPFTIAPSFPLTGALVGNGPGVPITALPFNAPNGVPTLDSLGNASSLPVVALGSNAARTLAQMAADGFNVKNNGAVGNGVNADGAAVAATFAQAGNGGTVTAPCGTYKIGQNIAQTLANLGHITFIGGGSGCTKLLFSGGNFGLTINWGGLYGSVSFYGVTIETDQINPSQPGLSIVNNNTLGGSNNLSFGSNNFYDVVFTTDHAFTAPTPTHYWGTGFFDQSVSEVNFWGGSCNFGTGITSGKCYSINGTSSEEAIVINFNGVATFNCDTGVFYGNFVEGVYLTNFQSTGCNTGVITTGTNQDSLVITGSQFEDNTVAININNVNFNNFQLSNSVIIVPPNSTGILLQGLGGQIVGNAIGGVSTTGTTGILDIGVPSNGSGQQVSNNNFGNLGTAMKVNNGVTAAYLYATNNQTIGNTTDYALGTGGAAGLFIVDTKLRNLTNILACSSAIYPSQFIQADSTAAAWNGIAAGSGVEVMGIRCDSANWRNQG